MNEIQKPSQEEPEQRGIFDSIQGAKSRDPEAVEETLEQETQTTEPAQPAKEAGEAVEAKTDDGRLGKATQRIAQLERQINQIGPWAQFGMAVGNDPKGKKIVERYQRGEGLFADMADQEAVAEIQEERAQQGEPPLTRKELADVLDEREAARGLAQEINSLAEEELPEFKKIRRNPKYAEFLDFARQSVWGGRTPLHESVVAWDNDYAAKEMTAVKKAYSMYLADNPKVLEAAKKAGEKQATERAAEAAAVSSSRGSTTSSSQEEPEKTPEEEAIDRMLTAKGIGTSFAKVGSKR